jgi:hypothetical protein
MDQWHLLGTEEKLSIVMESHVAFATNKDNKCTWVEHSREYGPSTYNGVGVLCQSHVVCGVQRKMNE